MKRPKKNDFVYVWTKKMETVSKGRKKAGEPATFNGKMLDNEDVLTSWKKLGYIEEGTGCKKPEKKKSSASAAGCREKKNTKPITTRKKTAR